MAAQTSTYLDLTSWTLLTPSAADAISFRASIGDIILRATTDQTAPNQSDSGLVYREGSGEIGVRLIAMFLDPAAQYVWAKGLSYPAMISHTTTDTRATGGQAIDPNDAATQQVAITPSDTGTLPVGIRALYVGQPGDAVIELSGGDGVTATYTNLQAGVIYPIAARKIYATGTTAANFIGLI